MLGEALPSPAPEGGIFVNKKSMTLQAWAHQWLELYVKPVAKPSGYEHYRDNLEKHILPCLGRYSLEQLTTPVVQAFLNRMGECGTRALVHGSAARA